MSWSRKQEDMLNAELTAMLDRIGFKPHDLQIKSLYWRRRHRYVVKLRGVVIAEPVGRPELLLRLRTWTRTTLALEVAFTHGQAGLQSLGFNEAEMPSWAQGAYLRE